MNQNRAVAVFKASWKVLVPAALVLGVAFAGKVYFTQQTIPVQRVQAANVDAILAAAVEKLEAHVDAFEGEGNPFPAAAGWTPPQLSCGEPTPTSPEAWEHPTWKVLGIAPEGATPYQYRFRGDKRHGFELLARADVDCDGVYQVRRLKGKTVWTGGLDTGILTVDNPGE